MKVRLLGNTIRLRVKMFETEAILEKGMIEEVLEFGPSDESKLRFQVIKGQNGFAIEQKGMIISITIPAANVETWATTDLVGIEEMITTSHGSPVKFLIEKDWACLDRERDDEEGSYPNPLEDCGVE